MKRGRPGAEYSSVKRNGCPRNDLGHFSGCSSRMARSRPARRCGLANPSAALPCCVGAGVNAWAKPPAVACIACGWRARYQPDWETGREDVPQQTGETPCSHMTPTHRRCVQKWPTAGATLRRSACGARHGRRTDGRRYQEAAHPAPVGRCGWHPCSPGWCRSAGCARSPGAGLCMVAQKPAKSTAQPAWRHAGDN
jgi:hypothetical protein